MNYLQLLLVQGICLFATMSRPAKGPGNTAGRAVPQPITSIQCCNYQCFEILPTLKTHLHDNFDLPFTAVSV